MRESSKQTLAILVITVFIIAAFFVFFNLLKPEFALMKDKMSQATDKNKAIDTLNEYQAKWESVQDRYAQISGQIGGINLALPVSAEPAEVLAILDAISRSKGIYLNSITFKEVAPSVAVISDNSGLESETGSPSDTGKAATLNNVSMQPSVLQVEASLTTSYENFKGLLSELEKEARLIDVLSVKFSPAVVESASAKGAKTTNRNLFTYTLTLNAYFQPIK